MLESLSSLVAGRSKKYSVERGADRKENSNIKVKSVKVWSRFATEFYSTITDKHGLTWTLKDRHGRAREIRRAGIL